MPSTRSGASGRRWAGIPGYDADGQGRVALLSDFFPKTTGEMIHVDGGLHSTGA